jgi:cytochrome c-type biogenesis protein CcmH
MGLTRRLTGTPGTSSPPWLGTWVLILVSIAILLMPVTALAATDPAKADVRSSSPEMDERVREVASELRCVVCQNLSVADSPSDLAKEMRNLVRELLQQGKTPEEIKAYFQSRYGDFVLLEPPKRGFNLLVWGLPFAALVVGAYGVYLVAKRWTVRGHEAAPPPDSAYAERVRQELKERERPSGS